MSDPFQHERRLLLGTGSGGRLHDAHVDDNVARSLIGLRLSPNEARQPLDRSEDHQSSVWTASRLDLLDAVLDRRSCCEFAQHTASHLQQFPKDDLVIAAALAVLPVECSEYADFVEVMAGLAVAGQLSAYGMARAAEVLVEPTLLAGAADELQGVTSSFVWRHTALHLERDTFAVTGSVPADVVILADVAAAIEIAAGHDHLRVHCATRPDAQPPASVDAVPDLASWSANVSRHQALQRCVDIAAFALHWAALLPSDYLTAVHAETSRFIGATVVSDCTLYPAAIQAHATLAATAELPNATVPIFSGAFSWEGCCAPAFPTLTSHRHETSTALHSSTC